MFGLFLTSSCEYITLVVNVTFLPNLEFAESDMLSLSNPELGMTPLFLRFATEKRKF